jgi:hypothetical protein
LIIIADESSTLKKKSSINKAYLHELIVRLIELDDLQIESLKPKLKAITNES